MGRQTSRYRFRHLYVDRYESIMRRVSGVSGTSASEVFGSWADWGDSWSAERETRFVGEMPPRVSETWADAALCLFEVINIENIRRYALQGQERRPEQLTSFIRLHEASGELGLVGESKASQYVVARWGECTPWTSLRRRYQRSKGGRLSGQITRYRYNELFRELHPAPIPRYRPWRSEEIRRKNSALAPRSGGILRHKYRGSQGGANVSSVWFPHSQEHHISITAYDAVRRMGLRRRKRDSR